MALNDSSTSGDNYTLHQLLGGDISIVIPDMQRDYCWGMPVADGRRPRATVFVTELVEMYMEQRIMPLGLLYGYENPIGSKCFYIIDGQQRLTTLYLLVGMLYRRTPTEALRRLLISDYQLIDEHRPRLVYQVRDVAMYFLSDLVINFFLDRNGRLSQIEKSNWYSVIYDSDPTIQSFLSALRLIDQVLEDAAKENDWDFGEFADFVTQRLTFMYHDLQDRPKAERAFVTINTTAESLTAAQYFKSVIAAADSDGSIMQRWEQIEQWAWMHRIDTAEHPATSDQIIDRLLGLWVAKTDLPIAEALSADVTDGVFNMWRDYQRLVEAVPEAIHRVANVAEDLYLLLPSLQYIRRWGLSVNDSALATTHIRRFWDFLENITHYQRVSTSGSDLNAAISVVQKMPSAELTSIVNVHGSLPPRIINDEELNKLRFLAEATDTERAYVLMQRAQRHPLLAGRISALLSWSSNAERVVDLGRLNRYIDYIYEIWGEKISQNTQLDLLRRALLTLRHPGYPLVRRNDSYLSLCWQDYDWQRLMSLSPGIIRQLIDRISSMRIPAKDAMRHMVEGFNDRTSPYFFIIKDGSVLARCSRRTLLRLEAPFIGMYYTEGNELQLQWYVEHQRVKYDTEAWRMMRPYGNLCIYTDHRDYNLSIDLYYTPKERSPYRLEVFARKDAANDRPAPINIDKMIRALGYPVRYDSKRSRYYTFLSDAPSALEMIQRITNCDITKLVTA